MDCRGVPTLSPAATISANRYLPGTPFARPCGQNSADGRREMGEMKRALAREEQEQRNQDRFASTLANLGGIAASRGELDSALHLYQQALTIHQEMGNYYALSQTFLATSRLLAALGRKDDAI